MLIIRVFFIVLFFLLFQGCSSHFFYPTQKTYRTPEYYGLKYDEVQFNSLDKTSLNAWRIYPEGESKGLVFVAHGNAQNLSAHFVSWIWLVKEGYEVFIFDYREYGKSEGQSSIKGSVEDTKAALNYVEEHYKGDYFACGQSLGGTLLLNALDGRDNSRIKAVIIDSTFVGFSDIASYKMSQAWILWPFQWIPDLTLSDEYDAKDKLDNLNLPILFLHGSRDMIVSPNNSWQLYDVSHKPREFWLLKDAKHTKVLDNKTIQKDFLQFLLKDRTYYEENYSSMKIYD